MKKRIRALCGGTSSSKTISILLALINLAQSDTSPTLTSIVSESFPHLRKGAMRDFLNIMQAHRYFVDDRWNKTESTYEFETGSKIEFFSADQPSKVRGPRRDRLFLNEANNIHYEAFDQLEVRTKEFIYMDWNPVSEFWYYTELKDKRDDVEEITLTYLDNEALSPEIVRSIEQRRSNKGWWKVYGLGQLGEVDGKIYKDWQIIDELPHEARLVRRGLDFGYSNDPTAIVDIYEYNSGFIFDEVMYQVGVTNRVIADTLKALPNVVTIADSAEPKSIDEIKLYGVNIIGAEKGPGSVSQGIQFVQAQRISVTKRSVNIIREYRNYLWQTDKNGKILNEPEHAYSHSCFPAGTIANGVPIETIGVQTGVEDVYEYDISGCKIRATANHPVLTARGFVDIDALRYDDTVWIKKQLFTKVSSGVATPIPFSTLRAFITQGIRRLMEAAKRDCTDLFGKKLTAKSLLDIMFITLTTIPRIIGWIISSSLAAANTCRFTLIAQSTSPSPERTSRKLSPQPLSGQRQKKDKRSVLKWAKRMLSTFLGTASKEIATSAEKSTNAESVLEDSATTIAGKRHYVGRVPVYNLKTRSGMYRADGLLVSNCDAIRYGMNGYGLKRKPTVSQFIPKYV